MNEHEQNKKIGDQTYFCTKIGAKNSLGSSYFCLKIFHPLVHFILDRAQNRCFGPQFAKLYNNFYFSLIFENRHKI